MTSPREIVGKRVAQLFKDGDLVNLGIGMPTEAAKYLPDNINVILHSVNGLVGLGPAPKDNVIADLVNVAGQPATILPGGAFVDCAISYSIVRGGHVDATVLGALQVDEKGNLANWIIPGERITGIGGAMDLATGAKKVIIAMEHTAKDGSPKILKKCSLPLTATAVVNYIVTELGFMEVTSEGIVLKELAPGVTVEDIQVKTEATLIISPNLEEMKI